ncbi:MAG: peptidoglycan DD-metalloendopeptidase family protein, partial [Spirochaetales bacterium]|nr:peptidoglycan DD-metalloendopeptidase family protein [Spirochaetales bacterium]
LNELYETIAEDSTYLDFYGNRFWQETYAYDEANNIDYRLDGWGKMDYSYNDGDRLTQLGEKSFSYDPNGNLSIETFGVQVREYTYTPENRAASITQINPQALLPEAGKSFDIAYGYDGLGRKVLSSSTIPEGGHGQHDNTRHEYFYYDGLSFEKTLERLEEVGHNGRVTLEALNEYHYGYGEILSLQDVSENFSGAWRGQRERTNLFQDVLGSTVYSTRKNHGEAFSYDAFGRVYEGNLEFAGDIGYNGKRMDSVTKIIDYGYRHYSPQNKRWMTVDPIRDGLSWYVYVNNSPLVFTDPFGLCTSTSDSAATLEVVELPENLPADYPIWPVQGYGEEAVTSGFGSRTNPFTGKPSNHTGIDIGVPEGTNVLAVLDGKVKKVGTKDVIYGNYVILDHGEGLETLYAHLEDKPNLSVNDDVKKGTVLGGVGNTGQSTGSHLHFSQKQDGEYMDPFDSIYSHGSVVIE